MACVTHTYGRSDGRASSHRGFQVLVDRGEELLGALPLLLGADEQREVLGHLAAFDGIDADALERAGELADVGRLIEAPARLQPARPGEDRSDRVGRGRLLPLGWGGMWGGR